MRLTSPFDLGVCWLRLDFETFTTLGPADSQELSGGVCRDTFKVVVSML